MSIARPVVRAHAGELLDQIGDVLWRVGHRSQPRRRMQLGGARDRAQQDPQPKEVALAGRRAALEQLRRQETQRSHDLVGMGDLALELREAEVGQPGVTIAVEQDVGGLDVSVQHAVVVDGCDGREQLTGERLDRTRFERGTIQALAQGRARDVVHDDVRLPCREVVIVDADDIRVPDLHLRSRLAREARHGDGVLRECVGNHLERDRPLEALVPCSPDRGHPADSDHLLQAVPRADLLARGQTAAGARGMGVISDSHLLRSYPHRRAAKIRSRHAPGDDRLRRGRIVGVVASRGSREAS